MLKKLIPILFLFAGCQLNASPITFEYICDSSCNSDLSFQFSVTLDSAIINPNGDIPQDPTLVQDSWVSP